MKIQFENSIINFYFSFQCPYSYILWKVLCKLLKEHNDISVNPINIGLNPKGNRKFNYIENWSDERWLKLSNYARLKGIVLKKPLNFVSENLVARSIKSYDPVSCEYYINSIFKAVFSENIDITIPSELCYFLQSEGNDSTILMEASKDSNTLIDYENQIDYWGKKRIRLTPTIELEKERLAGLVSSNQIENLLRPFVE